MAYLTTFRKHGVGPGNWFAIPCCKHDPELDRLLDLVDGTLNSWKEAHNIFSIWQQDQPKVNSEAFFSMRRLVHKVVRGEIMNTETSWPNEALTYALLERWIAVRQAQLKLDGIARR